MEKPEVRVVVLDPVDVFLLAGDLLDLDPEYSDPEFPDPDLDSPAGIIITLVEMAHDPETDQRDARDAVKVFRHLLEARAIVLAGPEGPEGVNPGAPEGARGIVVELPAAVASQLYGEPVQGPFRRCAWVEDSGDQCSLPARARAGNHGPHPRWCDGHTVARKAWLRKHGNARPPYKPCCIAWQLDADPGHTGRRCPQCKTMARKDASAVTQAQASRLTGAFGNKGWHAEGFQGLLSDLT
jgi:hypothetical protein